MGGLGNGTNVPEVASGDRLALLWRRTKEHRIAQWTVGYVAVAYGIQHAVTLTSEAFKWPDGVIRISMLLLALGLPVAMTLAWYHGERAARRISGPELTIISLLLVGVSILFYAFVRPSAQTVTAAAPAIQEASVVAARTAAADPRGAVAVAVLPFANLSDDRQQEYFSDGMTDEIGTALAKIPDLRVVARQSAFRFKNTKEDSRQIGQSLGATHLIEGSVYKAGNRVRITAELVRADNGLSIWSDKYDRELTDVFAVQEDIARAIAASFHMTLGLKPGENLVNDRTANSASHDDYLHAKSLVRSRNFRDAGEAIQILEKVVARDPNYAAAWGLLAEAHHDALLVDPQVAFADSGKARAIVYEHQSKGTSAAEHAIRLDPKDVDGLIALGNLRFNGGDRIAAADLMQQALMLDPDNPDALHSFSVELADLGFMEQAVSMRERLLKIEPYVPNFVGVTGRVLFAAGKYDAATETYKKFNFGAAQLAPILAAQGQSQQAIDVLTKAAANNRDPETAGALKAAAALLRGGSAWTPSSRPDLGRNDWVYVYAGAPEQFLVTYEKGLQIGFVGIGGTNAVEWAPAYRSVRKTARFKKYARDSGMVAYWRAKGWPPQCHPTTGDDFACD